MFDTLYFGPLIISGTFLIETSKKTCCGFCQQVKLWALTTWDQEKHREWCLKNKKWYCVYYLWRTLFFNKIRQLRIWTYDFAYFWCIYVHLSVWLLVKLDIGWIEYIFTPASFKCYIMQSNFTSNLGINSFGIVISEKNEDNLCETLITIQNKWITRFANYWRWHVHVFGYKQKLSCK